MKWYSFNIERYNDDTEGLSLAEHGAYRLLLDEYYRREKGISQEFLTLLQRIRCKNSVERHAVDQVLARFFVHESDGLWHQKKADEEIRRYVDNTPNRETRQASIQARRQRYRDRRSALFALLQKHGCMAPWNAGVPALEDLCKRMGLSVDNPEQGPNGHASSDASSDASKDKSGDRQRSVHVMSLNSGTRPRSDGPSAAADAAAQRVCLAVKIFGIQNANPFDEKLRELLGRRATQDDFSVAAAEARATGGSWAQVLGLVEARLRTRSL